jgi:2-amino-4-hydroxy-6-hydroxymethyldihydropteridine diphosphokinase
MNSSHPFFVSLGSNLGERERYLQKALQQLHEHPEVTITQFSSIYETDPVGNVEQGPFLNMVVQGETTFIPEALLELTQAIERDLGRIRDVHWGPRTIDIDILLYNNKRMDTEALVIPHPRMTERAFVLLPLAEIAPNCTIPKEGKTIQELVDTVQGEGVRRWKTKFKSGEGVFELFES